MMHDDQHGTAIITSAALINALEIAGKRPEDIRLVVNGAGAAAIACTDLYIKMGIRKENIVMCDSKGVITRRNAGSPQTGTCTPFQKPLPERMFSQDSPRPES